MNLGLVAWNVFPSNRQVAPLIALCCTVTTTIGASNDDNVEWNGIYSDRTFRSPEFPVRNQSFAVELRVFRGDITDARVRIWDGGARHHGMRWVRNEGAGRKYDVWQTTVRAQAEDFLYYRFEITDGNDTDYYNRLGMSETEPGSGDFLIDLTGFGNYPLGATPEDNSTVFRVWSRNADNVHVAGEFNGWNTRTHPLENNAGIWQGRVPGAKHGDEYRYLIENDGIHWRTDPHARKMTNSVGNSVIWDPDAYAWGDDDWITPFFEDMILYELHVGTFTGDAVPYHPAKFRDAVDHHLDHLVELGINVIELMPVTEFSGELSWGYNLMSQYAIESSYGSPDDLKYFINRCHLAGIGVIIDVVYNHMGGSDLAGNLLNYDGGELYFYPEGNGFRDTPWGLRPDFGIRQVREYLVETIRYWTKEYHVDGFRIDATSFIKVNTDGWRLLRDFKEVARTESLKSFVSAEQLPNDPSVTKPIDDGGAGLDSQWNDLFHDHLREALNEAAFGNPNMERLAQGMDHFDFGGVRAINYIESHDEVAVHGRAVTVADNSNPHSKFAYGRGKLCYGLVMFTAGIPLILQGQELMEDRAFGDAANNRIQWSYKDLFNDYYLACRDMTWLRRRAPAFRADSNQNIFHVNDGANVIAWHRWTGEGDDLVVVASFSNSNFDSYCIGMPSNGEWIEVFNSDASVYGGGNIGNGGSILSNGDGRDGLPASACIALPRMGVMVFAKSPIDMTPDFDADNDGIDDRWERANGLDPNDPNDARLDQDGDGMQALQEYYAGTDPRISISFFRIEKINLDRSGQAVLHWDSVKGRKYHILASKTLDSGNFIKIGSIEGNGKMLVFTDERHQLGDRIFYFVEIESHLDIPMR